MNIIVSTDNTVSFPEAEVYGIESVRILRHFEVVGKCLDTPRHIREAAAQYGFKPGDRVIVADRRGKCKTVTV